MSLRILHKNNVDFSIDQDGQITKTSVWEILPDSSTEIATGWTDFEAAVKTWAGNIGDAWRKPGATSSTYTSDSTVVVTDISFKSSARYIYEVTFTGKSKHTTATLRGGITESENNFGEKEKTAVWLVHSSAIDAWRPAIGSVLSWAGAAYLCDSVDIQPLGSSGEYEVTLRAVDMAVLILGEPSFSRSATYESIKTAKWRVVQSEYDAFVAAHDINSDASSWAGTGYYVTNINSTPKGSYGHEVTVEAKHINFREIEVVKRTTFEGIDIRGNVKKGVEYSGKWAVHSDYQADFEAMAGSSAESWADTGYIVYTINPVKISNTEWEYTLTAKNPLDDSGAQFSDSGDDRSRLTERIDTDVEFADFKTTANQAGYSEKINASGYTDTLNTLNPGTWVPATHCPFTATSELPRKYYETGVSCTIIVKTQYKKADPTNHLQELANWYHVDKIFTGTVGNLTGSFRKVAQRVERIQDNEGADWSKVERRYMLAPAGKTWNSTFWSGL